MEVVYLEAPILCASHVEEAKSQSVIFHRVIIFLWLPTRASFFSFLFFFFQNFVDCSDQLFSFLDLDGRQALWSGSSWPPKYAGEFASFISCHFASAPRRNKAPQKWIRKTWQVKEDEWSCIVIRFVMCLAQDEGPSNLLPRSKMKHYCLFYF